MKNICGFINILTVHWEPNDLWWSQMLLLANQIALTEDGYDIQIHHKHWLKQAVV